MFSLTFDLFTVCYLFSVKDTAVLQSLALHITYGICNFDIITVINSETLLVIQ